MTWGESDYDRERNFALGFVGFNLTIGVLWARATFRERNTARIKEMAALLHKRDLAKLGPIPGDKDVLRKHLGSCNPEGMDYAVKWMPWYRMRAARVGLETQFHEQEHRRFF